MGRLYSASVAAVAVSAAQDFFELTPATDKPCLIHEVRLGQYTDFGDAQAELVSVQIIRGYTTSGSGGSTVTSRALDQVDSAAGATVEANNTTVASAGTAHILVADSFNVAAGWLFLPTPEMRPRASAATGGRIVVRITAPADSLTMNGTLVYEEL